MFQAHPIAAASNSLSGTKGYVLRTLRRVEFLGMEGFKLLDHVLRSGWESLFRKRGLDDARELIFNIQGSFRKRGLDDARKQIFSIQGSFQFLDHLGHRWPAGPFHLSAPMSDVGDNCQTLLYKLVT